MAGTERWGCTALGTGWTPSPVQAPEQACAEEADELGYGSSLMAAGCEGDHTLVGIAAIGSLTPAC